jgi:serine/threonine-protein kinase
MPADAPDPNVLFGIVALQNGLIDQGQLVSATQSWIHEKHRPLAKILANGGALDAGELQAVDAMVGLILNKKGGNTTQGLSSLNVSPSARDALASIGDAEVDSTLNQIRSSSDSTQNWDPERTTAAAGADGATRHDAGASGSNADRFRILRAHARGGLGAIFIALDRELNREVAVKQILDVHADNPSSRRRFLIEAEITGGLEHPGIVPVYSLGSYGDGRPYYAMRFIKGDSLKTVIKGFHAARESRPDEGVRSLELRQLLRRFIDLCNTIDYAHSRGVLHRDIKPSNVILGNYGETLVVDWGLAKPLGLPDREGGAGEQALVPSSASGSGETLPGSALGTPSYMSPEQAEGDLERLGPQSDVYGLGATLYCLLTGKPPVEADDLGVVLGAVRKGEVRPPRQHDPTIDRALEAICLKAMARHQTDRYPTARALADDVERWTADESISAWREPYWRLARRWGRRHRTLVVAGIILLAAATAGLTVGNLLLGRANSRTEHQRALAERNLGLALEAAARAERQRERAESNFRLARDAVNEFSTQVSENTLLRSPLPGLQPLRNELLKTALRYNQAFVDSQGEEPGLKADLARARYRMGGITEVVGSKTEALSHLEKSRALWEDLLKNKPDDSQYQLELARAFRDIAVLLSENLGRAGEARQPFQEAQRLLEQLFQSDPARAEYRTDLATTYGFLYRWFDNQGDHPQEARRYSELALDLWEKQARFDAGARRNVATHSTVLGYWNTRYGTADDALRFFAKSREILQGLIAETPRSMSLREELRRLEVNIGYLHDSRTGRFREALRHYDIARSLAEQNARENPSVISLQLIWASTSTQPTSILRQLRQTARGAEYCRKAIQVLEGIIPLDPSNSRVHGELVQAHTTLAEFLQDAGNLSEAVQELDRARSLFDRVGSQMDYQIIKVTTLAALAEVRRRQGLKAQAIQSAAAAVELIRRLKQEGRLAPEDLQKLGVYYELLSDLQLEDGQAAQSVAILREAMAIAPDPIVRIELAYALFKSGHPTEATRELEQGWASLDAGITTIPERQLRRARSLALSHSLVSSLKLPLADAQRRAHAGDADRAISALAEVIKAGYGDPKQIQTDAAFAALRTRPDFQVLMMDLAFPKEAIAPGG